MNSYKEFIQEMYEFWMETSNARIGLSTKDDNHEKKTKH